MDGVISASRDIERYTTDYVRRLLIERRFIYAKLYNPGGSVILRASDIVDHDRPMGYSTEIGNTFHLDLIELDMEFRKLIREKKYSKKEIEALLTWADGFTSQQAADYLHLRGAVSVRKLRERGLRKLQEKMDGQGEKPRGTSDRTLGGRRQENEDDTVQVRDIGREKTGDDKTEGITDVSSQ